MPEVGTQGGSYSPSAFLQIAKVSKSYGNAPVLTGVSLDIGAQEFVCLLGPSGCGKTTLLKILCGIEESDGGSVLLRGQDITRQSPAQRRFGVVFQSYALFPNLSALDNVAYGLGRMERGHRLERARAMLDLVGLSAHAGKYPTQLSGGQQQRIALARALAPQPQMLLLDEPLSALDAQVRHALRHEIRKVQQQLKIPTVMVTHDQDEALAIADRVVLMNQGRIEQVSTPASMYAQPVSEFSARFIGRMNLWRAKPLADRTVAVASTQLELTSPLPPASNVWLGIRPEQVRLMPFDPALARRAEARAKSVNTTTATVDEAIFCGAYISVRLDSPQLGGIVLAEVATPFDGTNPWLPGVRCQVTLPPEALHVIPA